MANTDTPGVIIPPALIGGAAVGFGVALDFWLPNILIQSIPYRVVVGAVIGVAGATLTREARNCFTELGVDFRHTQPPSSLVTSGVYSHLRNPMYVGLLLFVFGLGIIFGSDWTIVMLVPMALALHYGAVLPEERYLEVKFGDDYRHYKASVPRWGLF